MNGPTVRKPALAAATLAIILFVLVLSQAVRRPLWGDELMAMVNYPVGGIAELLAPLPYYSQAAPPLFNLLSSVVAPLPTEAGRLALATLITAGLSLAAYAVYRRWWAPILILSFMVAAPNLLIYSTEFKYYGLEMLGTGLIIAWFLTKGSEGSIIPRDAVALIGAMLCGISTIVIAGVALAAHVGTAKRMRFSLPLGEMLVGGIIAAAALLYYLAIRHGTSIQIMNYPDSYGIVGVRAALQFLKQLLRILPITAVPLLAVSLGVCLVRRSAIDLRLLGLAGCVVVAFTLLSAVGLYPASSIRHVIWAGAFAIFLAGNAVLSLIEPTALQRSLRRRGGVLLALMAVPALGAGAARAAHPYTVEDNERLTDWLVAQPPQDIGLWIGAQPMIDFYRRTRPELDKHRYFGQRGADSVIVRPAFTAPAFLAQPPEAIGRAVERHRFERGSEANNIVYRLTKDYAAPARSLIADAPRGRNFAIIASHLDLQSKEDLAVARRDALFAALGAAGCAHRIVLAVKGGFVLEARCR